MASGVARSLSASPIAATRNCVCMSRPIRSFSCSLADATLSSAYLMRSVLFNGCIGVQQNTEVENRFFPGVLYGPDDAIPGSKGVTPEDCPKRSVPRPPRSKRLGPGQPPPAAFFPDPVAYLPAPAQAPSIANAAGTVLKAAEQPRHSPCRRVFARFRSSGSSPVSARSRCIPRESLPEK